MPNFIPKIEFITVADWFRTSEVGDGQKSDLEKASVLGRKLVAAENALNRAKVEGQYRPEEYQIAIERLKQLRDLMPTQRLVVRVPFSGDNNDSRIFCSQGLQLRPSLLGWHGRPPERGRGVDDLRRGEELQRPRHPRDRGRKAGQGRARQPQPAGGHDRQGRLPTPERRTESPSSTSTSPRPTASRITCSSRWPAPTRPQSRERREDRERRG